LEHKPEGFGQPSFFTNNLSAVQSIADCIQFFPPPLLLFGSGSDFSLLLLLKLILPDDDMDDNGIGGGASGEYSPKDYPALYQMYKGYGYSDTAAEKAALEAIGGKKEAVSDLSSDRAMLQNYAPNMWGQ